MREAGGRERRREHGDEDAETERAAELVRDVDEPRRRAGVLGRDAGDAGRGERGEGGARCRGRARSSAARSRGSTACPRRSRLSHAIAGERHRDSAASSRASPSRAASLGTTKTIENMTSVMRQERDPGLERAVAAHALQVLGEEEELPEHRADEEHAREVCADALAAREELQRRDRLLRAPLVDDEERRAGSRRRRTRRPCARRSSRPWPRGRTRRRARSCRASRSPRRRGRSDRCGARSRAGSAARATTSAIPIGTLMNRPQRHESQSVSTPPSTSPTLPPPPATAP